MIVGIDEAGRGPLLGPLVMVGVAIKHMQLMPEFKDSKQLTPAKREALFEQITQEYKYAVRIVTNQEIDEFLTSGVNLNQIEARKSAEILNELQADHAILDCPSRNIQSYINSVSTKLDNKETKITAEFKADENYSLVAAASILAKVIRDKQIEQIKNKYQVDCGSGYPSDPTTKAFLKAYVNKIPVFRTTWAPVKAYKESQVTLENFN